jgi:phospholipid/cholesterol/gamma-HCH transport system substrate-binding protein
MSDEKNLEMRVGLVVLAALAVLVVFVLLIGDFHFAKQQRIFVEFKFSGAISAGAPVKISGVPIGRVDAIEFIGDQAHEQTQERLQTRLTVAIDNDKMSALPAGTEFFVSTQGILGEQYLEAVPGDRYGPPITPGITLRGIDPPRTDLLLARMNTVLDAFARLITDNKDLLSDFAKAATGLTRNIDTLLTEKRSSVGGAIDDFAGLAKSARRVGDKIDGALGTEAEMKAFVQSLQRTVKTLETDLPEISGRAKQTLTAVNEALEDKERLKRIVANLDAVSGNAVTLTDDAKVVVKKLRRGEGTVGALLTDEDIYDDLKELMRDLKQHPWKVIWRD